MITRVCCTLLYQGAGQTRFHHLKLNFLRFRDWNLWISCILRHTTKQRALHLSEFWAAKSHDHCFKFHSVRLNFFQPSVQNLQCAFNNQSDITKSFHICMHACMHTFTDTLDVVAFAKGKPNKYIEYQPARRGPFLSRGLSASWQEFPRHWMKSATQGKCEKVKIEWNNKFSCHISKMFFISNENDHNSH